MFDNAPLIKGLGFVIDGRARDDLRTWLDGVNAELEGDDVVRIGKQELEDLEDKLEKFHKLVTQQIDRLYKLADESDDVSDDLFKQISDLWDAAHEVADA